MKIEIGQHIKCFLRNSMIIEGLVEDWSEKEIVIQSLDQTGSLIIHQPSQDIILTKIVKNNLPKITPPPNTSITETEISNIDPEQNIDIQLRTKNIAQLKILKNIQERKIISEQLKDHAPSKVQPTKYAQPNFFKGK